MHPRIGELELKCKGHLQEKITSGLLRCNTSWNYHIDVDSLGANQIWMDILYNQMNHRDKTLTELATYHHRHFVHQPIEHQPASCEAHWLLLIINSSSHVMIIAQLDLFIYTFYFGNVHTVKLHNSQVIQLVKCRLNGNTKNTK